MPKPASKTGSPKPESAEPKKEHHELEEQLRKLILVLGRERTQEILAELASIGL